MLKTSNYENEKTVKGGIWQRKATHWQVDGIWFLSKVCQETCLTLTFFACKIKDTKIILKCYGLEVSPKGLYNKGLIASLWHC
jgi:hypothetical protein